MSDNLKKTVLYSVHKAAGATIVPFAGFEMPVQYPQGIIKEHNAVRDAVGIFDVSHMGEFIVFGKDAAKALDFILSNRISDMPNGKVRYSLVLNETGGIIDDILVYRYHEEKFMLVVNASNIEKDFLHIKNNLFGDSDLIDISENTALIAIQGPLSEELLSKVIDKNDLPTKYYSFKECQSIHGMGCLISKTGYTGENGYEIYCPSDLAEPLLNLILESGKELSPLLCGLGARDTLRLEAGMPLYSHELSESIFSLECGLDFAIKLDKENFIGKAALLEKEPLFHRLGAVVIGKGICREGAPLFKNGENVGYITSGGYSPTLKEGIAMIRVLKSVCAGDTLEAEVRGKRIPLTVVTLPFNYKLNKSN